MVAYLWDHRENSTKLYLKVTILSIPLKGEQTGQDWLVPIKYMWRLLILTCTVQDWGLTSVCPHREGATCLWLPYILFIIIVPTVHNHFLCNKRSRVESYSKLSNHASISSSWESLHKDFVPDRAIVPRLFTRSDPHKTAKNETMKNQNLPNDKTLPNDKEEWLP